MTDANLGPDEQFLHRSVLLFNRAQILSTQGGHPALRDYDVLISRDPDYGDYYFERAAVRRAAGLHARPSRTTPRRSGSARPSTSTLQPGRLPAGAGPRGSRTADLDRAVELEPDHLDTLVNRADLLTRWARANRPRRHRSGPGTGPVNVHLLTARASLLADAGDTEARRPASPRPPGGPGIHGGLGQPRRPAVLGRPAGGSGGRPRPAIGAR
ncbi:hypothetical protein GXW82_00395 [Streptacidiphilus sp. 4-A2]|nr:hypothetical protein [Streptacidiphilus sp. 4-A2]